MVSTRTALARLYRPRRFAEVATQEHVSETLRAAVARGRVAHAYLFAGPRGVGKTTAARVLAMALNCPRRTPAGEPCGECESCERIWSGKTSLDVVEIDAASNRGVDDARDLRERAMYAPTDERRFKVYIIDEAHMLTREAWNALLKILEEPPPRVIFVFATTEPQKIQQAAPPILSRCQRFDFRRLSVRAIVERLQAVLAAEQVAVPEEALVLIARRADGGMRDALSLLDQVLSFAEVAPGTDEVRRVLGLAGEELYLDLFEILAQHRHADVFRFVQRLLDEGHDVAEFYRGLADALRALTICRLEGPETADVRDDLRAAFANAAARFSMGDLLRMLAQVAELDADGRFRKSANPRLLLEALLLRFAHLDRTVELEALIRAAGGAPADAVPGAPPAPAAPAAPAPSGPSGAGRLADVGGQPAPARREPAGPRSAGASGEPGAGAAAGPPPMEWGDLPDSEPRRGGPSAGAAAALAPVPAEAPAPRSRAPAAPSGEPGSGAPPAGASAVEGALWSLAATGQGLPSGIAIFLRTARVVEVADDHLVLEMPPGPGLERLTSDPAALHALEEALAGLLGRRQALSVRALGPQERSERSPRFTPERVKADRLARLTREDPLLGRVVEDWDLELLD